MANDEKTAESVTITEYSTFVADFPSFHEQHTFSDIDIILDGQKIPSHKVVLAARSKYFKTILTANPTQSEIVITSVSMKIFKKILYYIYTGCISFDVDTIFDMIELANRFEIKSLQVTIREKLATTIDMENVFKILNAAILYNMEELRNACLSFMDNNSKEILQNDLINNLTQKSMVALLERDSFMVPEIEIFKCVANWCLVNKDKDNLVMETVRLNCLTIEEILTVVRPSKLIDQEKIFDILREISRGIPDTAKPRVINYGVNNENICSPKFKPKVISGSQTGVLLEQNRNTSTDNYAYCNVGDKNGITVKFDNLYEINHIYMKLWDLEESNYSYYIEVSQDQENWEKVVDYKEYRCHSFQNLYFDKVKVKYIRVVGVTSSIGKEFRVSFLEAYLKMDNIPKILSGMVCPVDNVAASKNGAKIVSSEHK